MAMEISVGLCVPVVLLCRTAPVTFHPSPMDRRRTPLRAKTQTRSAAVYCPGHAGVVHSPKARKTSWKRRKERRKHTHSVMGVKLRRGLVADIFTTVQGPLVNPPPPPHNRECQKAACKNTERVTCFGGSSMIRLLFMRVPSVPSSVSLFSGRAIPPSWTKHVQNKKTAPHRSWRHGYWAAQWHPHRKWALSRWPHFRADRASKWVCPFLFALKLCLAEFYWRPF